MQFFSFMFPFILNLIHPPRTSLVLEYPFGISENALCLMSVHSSKTVPPPGVPLPRIQFNL